MTLVSGVCAFLGPCAALQQQRLTDLKEMKVLQAKLRAEVNTFQAHNASLQKENETLAQSAKRLKELEKDLNTLTSVQGQNLNVMLKQIEEYKIIQDQIQESLQAKVIQNLITVVIRSDDDQDFVIDKNEVDGLLTKLKTIDGVNFSESNFKKAIAHAGYNVNDVLEQRGGFRLEAVLDVVKNLLDDKVPKEQNIFTLEPEQLLPPKLRSIKFKQPVKAR